MTCELCGYRPVLELAATTCDDCTVDLVMAGCVNGIENPAS